MTGYSTFPRTLELEPHHLMEFSVISKTFVGGGGPYPTAEMQSVYSTAPPADWATGHFWGVLHFCRDAVGDFYSPPDWAIWLFFV